VACHTFACSFTVQIIARLTLFSWKIWKPVYESANSKVVGEWPGKSRGIFIVGGNLYFPTSPAIINAIILPNFILYNDGLDNNNTTNTRTIFIVLSSMAPAICKSSLWVIWAKVGQRQVAANS